jgi:Flp pilus assembly protein CpaB
MKQKNIVLMVVAVGCGLVAAFLTSQMSAKPAQAEKVEVIVAARDIPIGSRLNKEDLKTALMRKTVSKDAVSPNQIETEEELLEKQFTRTVKKEDLIFKADVTKGSLISIPPGQSMVTLPINLASSVAGFVAPGSHVDVLASVRLDNSVRVLPILVNMLVLAVDASWAPPQQGGAYQNVSMVSFAVTRQQALLIKLAQARNCDLSLLLRNQEDTNTENDQKYKIEEVVKLLQGSDLRNPTGTEGSPDKTPEGQPMATAPVAPKVEMVKVPAAIDDIPAGTQITKDLIEEKFKLVELPKDLAADAVADLAPLVDDKQVLKTGLGKGQWVTKSLVGMAEPKAAPRDPDVLPKPGDSKPDVKKTRDIALHTNSGTRIYRYEETEDGGWKLIGEVNPNAKPEKKAPTPEKVD